MVGLEDVSTAMPVEVTARNNAAQAENLICWRGNGAFPEGLKWVGEGNRYDVQSADWVKHAPEAKARIWPVDLTSWVAEGLVETGTEPGPIVFANPSTAPLLERGVGDFRLGGGGNEGVGIDLKEMEVGR